MTQPSADPDILADEFFLDRGDVDVVQILIAVQRHRGRHAGALPGDRAARHVSGRGVGDAIAAGRLDPLPSVGATVGLDEVPDALDSARKSTGPARIIVHPNGDVE